MTLLRAVLVLALALGAPACLTPLAEGGLEPDAGRDGGAPTLDAGHSDAGQPPADFVATFFPSCAPNDGPATHFDFAAGRAATCAMPVAAFTVDLWTWTPAVKSYQLTPGFSGDGNGWACTALECFEVTSGTVVIESSTGEAVEGTVNLRLSNGETRAGRFGAIRCGVDSGVPPALCG